MFRLKKEAVPFVKEELATKVLPIETWTSHYNIDPKALEKVEACVVTYGHESKKGDSTSLAGWGENGLHYHFTIRFPSVKFSEHDRFQKGRYVREIMDRIQDQVNRLYMNSDCEEN